jgi:NAD(P)-dependent dehydrogenase (short-subunit alcohol dehydrogenase family)
MPALLDSSIPSPSNLGASTLGITLTALGQKTNVRIRLAMSISRLALDMNKEPIRGTAVVTGAGGGTGGAIVQRLAKHGFRVRAALRTQAAVDAFARQAGDRIVPLLLDVTDEASVEAAAHTVIDEVGEVGLVGLVNSVGIIVDGPLELITVENFRRQFEVNVTGIFAVTRAFLPALRQGRGRVVNIGGAFARTTMPFMGPLSASKAALASLGDAMRMEFAPSVSRSL